MNLVAVALSALALHGAPFKATVTAAGHSPVIGAKWAYSVKVVGASGKPVAARISIVIVDPIGGLHPVHRYRPGTTLGKAVTNVRIKGVFSDAIVWPPEARGYPLVLRVTVSSAGSKRTVRYKVTPR